MRKKPLWLIFLIPFFFTAIKTAFASNPYLSGVQSQFINSISQNKSLFASILDSSIKFSVIPIIIFTITIYEIFISRKPFDSNESLSLKRLKFSNGKTFADIWYFFINILSARFPILVTFYTLGLSNFSQNIIKPFENLFNIFYQSFLPNLESDSKGFIFIVISILILDFTSYLQHKLVHKVPLFWDIHEFHHSATEMTILSQYRSLPMEEILTAPIFLPISVFTGLLLNSTLSSGSVLPLITYSIYTGYTFVVGLLGHSSCKIVYPKPISKILMSPSLHLLHHSASPEHFNKNFGQFVTFWDLLFGTYLDESNIKNIEKFGVDNTQYNKYHPLYTVSILPLKKISKRFKNLII